MKLKSTAYLPALDGMRAISIVLVFLSHVVYYSQIYLGNLIPGGFGVTIFFYISGFLITRLLLEELKENNTINLKLFYIRRFLRLYPPLLVMLLIITLYLLIVLHFIPYRELLAALFYYENYYIVYGLKSGMTDNYGILWSLAIEEHFYLFYPLIFILFAKKPRQFVVAIIVLIIIPLLIRAFIVYKYNANEFSFQSTYHLSHCRFDSILYGCLSSLIIDSSFRDKYLKITSNKLVFIIGIVGILLSLALRSEYFRQTFRYTLQGLSLMILIPPILYNSSYAGLNRALSTKPMVLLGKWSYSIYLFHSILTDVSYQVHNVNKVLFVIVYTVGSLLLALGSYYYVEQPFFKLRKRFGSKIMEEKLPAPQLL